MNQILGLSFSDYTAYLLIGSDASHAINGTLVKSFPFPVAQADVNLFNEQNLETLAQKIQAFKKDNYISETLFLRVALPYSYAITKKIAVPDFSDKNSLMTQVRWEFSNYLPEAIDQYKIVKTDVSFEYPRYKETHFIAISKKIIQGLIRVAEKSGVVLDELVLDVFCLDRYLRTNNLIDFSAIQVISRIDLTQISFHVYLEGKYYTSFIDPVNQQLPNFDFNSKVLELNKDRLKQIGNLIAQNGYNQSSAVQYFVHGPMLSDALVEEINQAFDKPLYRLPVVAEEFKHDQIYQKSLEILGLMRIRTNL